MAAQTILIIAFLAGSMGFLLYRMIFSVRNLALNKAPSCHGNNDQKCPSCHRNNPDE